MTNSELADGINKLAAAIEKLEATVASQGEQIAALSVPNDTVPAPVADALTAALAKLPA